MVPINCDGRHSGQMSQFETPKYKRIADFEFGPRDNWRKSQNDLSAFPPNDNGIFFEKFLQFSVRYITTDNQIFDKKVHKFFDDQ